MFILPYKKGSKSAKSLAKSLEVKRLKQFGTKKVFRKPIINWGNSKKTIESFMLNKTDNVNVAVNKLKAFQKLLECNISIPDFTTEYEVAKQWILDEEIVVARSLLESHSGKGITICHIIEDLPQNSKVYVKYFKKTYEFRVHIFKGKVIDYIQKRKRNEITEVNKYVRSYDNGWVFCRDNAMVLDNIKTLAVDAVNALGLDFGAVDIVMKANGKAKVLEVNTAPALQGTTLKCYTKAIKEWSENV